MLCPFTAYQTLSLGSTRSFLRLTNVSLKHRYVCFHCSILLFSSKLSACDVWLLSTACAVKPRKPSVSLWFHCQWNHRNCTASIPTHCPFNNNFCDTCIDHSMQGTNDVPKHSVTSIHWHLHCSRYNEKWHQFIVNWWRFRNDDQNME